MNSVSSLSNEFVKRPKVFVSALVCLTLLAGCDLSSTPSSSQVKENHAQTAVSLLFLRGTAISRMTTEMTNEQRQDMSRTYATMSAIDIQLANNSDRESTELASIGDTSSSAYSNEIADLYRRSAVIMAYNAELNSSLQNATPTPTN